MSVNLTPLKFGTDFIASRYCQSTGSHAARTTVWGLVANHLQRIYGLVSVCRYPVNIEWEVRCTAHSTEVPVMLPSPSGRHERDKLDSIRTRSCTKGWHYVKGWGAVGALLRTLRRQPGYLAYQEAPRWKQLGRPPVEPGTRIPHGRKRTWPRRITKLAHSRRASFAC